VSKPLPRERQPITPLPSPKWLVDGRALAGKIAKQELRFDGN
jgi:hypothetical protein